MDWGSATYRREERQGEIRYASLALNADRLHHIVWTPRGNSTRIISLRRANVRGEHSMTGNRRNILRNTPGEEVEIAKQIADNPDEREWTGEDWANAMTAEEPSPEFAKWASEH